MRTRTLVDVLYEKYYDCPIQLRHQAVWRFSPVAVADLRADENFRRQVASTVSGGDVHPGSLLLGHPVSVRPDVDGFYLDGRPERPKRKPKRRR